MNLLFVAWGIMGWCGDEFFLFSCLSKHWNLFIFVQCEAYMLRFREELLLRMVVLTWSLLFFSFLYHGLQKAALALVLWNTKWYWLVKCRHSWRHHVVSLYADTFLGLNYPNIITWRHLIWFIMWGSFRCVWQEVVWYVSSIVLSVTVKIVTTWRPGRTLSLISVVLSWTLEFLCWIKVSSR